MKRTLLSALFVLPMTASANWFGGPYVEQGFAGYCVHKPSIGGIIGMQGGFQEVKKGPGKYGLTPKRIKCEMVDLRTRRMTEKFTILSKDELRMTMNVYITLRVKSEPAAIKDLIENYGTDQNPSDVDVDSKEGDPLWYTRNIEEPFRTIVRQTAQVYESANMIASRDQIRDDILTKLKSNDCSVENSSELSSADCSSDLRGLFDGTPYELVRVDVGDIQYPKKIVDAIEDQNVEDKNLIKAQKQEKVSAAQAKVTENQAEGKKLAAIKKAQGEAEAIRLIKEELTADYIKFLEAQAQIEAAKGANKTVFFFDGSEGAPQPVIDMSDELTQEAQDTE